MRSRREVVTSTPQANILLLDSGLEMGLGSQDCFNGFHVKKYIYMAEHSSLEKPLSYFNDPTPTIYRQNK